MKPSELLQQYGWCQGSYARDKSGASIAPHEEYADSFCLIGACCRCDATTKEIESVYQHIKNVYGKYAATLWNDEPGRVKQDVIDVLKAVGL